MQYLKRKLIFTVIHCNSQAAMTLLSPSAAAWLKKIQNPQRYTSRSLSSLSENEIYVISGFLCSKDLHCACQVSQGWKRTFASLFLMLKINLHAFLCNWSNIRKIVNIFRHDHSEYYSNLSCLEVCLPGAESQALIEILDKFKNLKALTIENMSLSRQLILIIRSLTKLQYLKLHNMHTNNYYLTSLYLEYPLWLISLSIDFSVSLSFNKLNSNNLRYLHLNQHSFNHDRLELFLQQYCINLQCLKFEECQLSLPFRTCIHLCVKNISNLKQLYLIDCIIKTTYVPLDPFSFSTNFQDQMFDNIENKKLTHLWLVNSSINQREMVSDGSNGDWLRNRFPNIIELNISKCEQLFRYRDVAKLVKLKQLKRLYLNENSFLFYNFDSFDSIINPLCKRLEYLNLSRIFTIDSTFLMKSSLNDSNQRIFLLRDWILLSHNLIELDISYNYQITFDTLKNLIVYLSQKSDNNNNNSNNNNNDKNKETKYKLKKISCNGITQITSLINFNESKQQCFEQYGIMISGKKYCHNYSSTSTRDKIRTIFEYNPKLFSINYRQSHKRRKSIEKLYKERKSMIEKIYQMQKEKISIIDNQLMMDKNINGANGNTIDCKRCGQRIKKQFVQDHKSACWNREIECCLCHKMLNNRIELICHYSNNQCLSYKMICFICNEILIGIKNYQKHIESHCINYDYQNKAQWFCHVPLTMDTIKHFDDKRDCGCNTCLHLNIVSSCSVCGQRILGCKQSRQHIQSSTCGIRTYACDSKDINQRSTRFKTILAALYKPLT